MPETLMQEVMRFARELLETHPGYKDDGDALAEHVLSQYPCIPDDYDFMDMLDGVQGL